MFMARKLNSHEHVQYIEKLTPCETRVLALVIDGLSNREIADATFVSINTVKFHLKNIYSKLGVARRMHAVRRAKESRLFTRLETDPQYFGAALQCHIHQPVGGGANGRAVEDCGAVSEGA